MKQIFAKFKVHDNIPRYEVCLGSVSKDFTKDEMTKISVNDTIYDFSVHYSAIQREGILHIHEYLMKNNNINYCLNLLNKLSLHYLVQVDFGCKLYMSE